MGARGGLILHPNFGTTSSLAGSETVQREQPTENDVNACRPGASPAALSIMLDLLETLRNLVVSGQEPASFLVALVRSGRAILVAGVEPEPSLDRLRNQHGPIEMAFRISAREIAGGMLLQVADATGGYVLEQFCRRGARGYEPLPHSWRQPMRASASSAYHRTSGLTPYWASRNSTLLNQRIC